jgi:farnesyl diphosphate synthase
MNVAHPGRASEGAPAEVRAALYGAAAAVERTLDQVLPRPAGGQARVQEAMRYAVFAGGKRLRPFLVIETAKLFGADRGGALRVAAAIEALHTYSLVHDDLPAMDNDDFRRGIPTTHRRFDDATAILAGDGLLTLAFELLADPATHPSAEVRARLVTGLARAAGSDGMIGGQMIDIEAPNRTLDAAEVVDLQRRKTGALFEFSCLAGGELGGATPGDLDALRAYARDLGLGFQIADDLLDVLGDAASAGKAVGKDAALGKATLVSLLGVDAARAETRRLAERAATALQPYGAPARALQSLPFFLLDRQN